MRTYKVENKVDGTIHYLVTGDGNKKDLTAKNEEQTIKPCRPCEVFEWVNGMVCPMKDENTKVEEKLELSWELVGDALVPLLRRDIELWSCGWHKNNSIDPFGWDYNAPITLDEDFIIRWLENYKGRVEVLLSHMRGE